MEKDVIKEQKPNDEMSATMDSLLAALDRIVNNLATDATESGRLNQTMVSEIYWKFFEIYKDAEFRHSYALISKKLGKYDNEQRDSIPIALLVIVSEADKIYKKTKGGNLDAKDQKNVLRGLTKLLDHVELECIRINRMQHVEYYAKEAKLTQDAAQTLHKKTFEEATALSDKVKGFHGQSITILGIFSAVVIGFMAEISLFSEGLSSLTVQNCYSILLYSAFVGTFVFDTLFMLMFVVSKVAGFSLSVRCENRSCSSCTDKKYWITRSFCKYPYVVWFNLLSVTACLILFFVTFSSPS